MFSVHVSSHQRPRLIGTIYLMGDDLAAGPEEAIEVLEPKIEALGEAMKQALIAYSVDG